MYGHVVLFNNDRPDNGYFLTRTRAERHAERYSEERYAGTPGTWKIVRRGAP